MLKRLPSGRLLRVIIGVSLLVLGAGAVLVSTAYEDPPTASVLWGDAPVNAGAGNLSDIRSHNSPTLVRNPVRAGNLVISNRVDTPRFACVLHASFDGGSRWTQTPIPVPRGEERKCFAPDAAFAPDGTLYLSFATLKGRGNVPNAVWTASSTDGGRTISKPVRAGGRLRFQVRLAVDRVNSRRIHLTWVKADDVGFLKFTETGNPIQSVRSDDGGLTWQKPVRVSDPSHARAVAPVPTVGSKGDLYVLYLDLGADRLDYEEAIGAGAGRHIRVASHSCSPARATWGGAGRSPWSLGKSSRSIVSSSSSPLSVPGDRQAQRPHLRRLPRRTPRRPRRLSLVSTARKQQVGRTNARQRHTRARRHLAVPATARGRPQRTP